MTDLDFDLLKELTGTPGLPGREDRVADLIQAHLPQARWEMHTDPLGNVVAHLPGEGEKILLIAHMDEVGLLVRRITPDGFLLLERLGGMGLRSLPGSSLDLWTAEGRLPARVGVRPQHLDTPSPLSLEAMYVDIGAASRAEAEAMGVRVGDGLTWSAYLARQGEHRVIGKALDDRLGCLALLTLTGLLQPGQCRYDLYLGFVVQEETTLMGGAPLAQALKPDLAIGVDGTLAFDTPDLEDQGSDIRLGCGPALKIMDAIRGRGVTYVPDLELAQSLQRLAKKVEIQLQPEVVVGLSTALAPIPFAAGGIRTAALSLPIRYHHSPMETADLRDASQLVDLLLAFLT